MKSISKYLEDPLYYTNKHSIDTTFTFSIPLREGWFELRNTEWANIYPIGSVVDRQGWKIHISSESKSAEKVLETVSNICYEYSIPFKHLVSRKRFLVRNSKQCSREHAGKFITCYPKESQLGKVLDTLETALLEFEGPYILSDKRWGKSPIYLRYGILRPWKKGDEPVTDENNIIVNGKEVFDKRTAEFIVPEGLKIPVTLEKWINCDEERVELPFEIQSAITYSNCGGIYRGNMLGDKERIIIRESRPFTGLDLNGVYANERLLNEENALKN